jgi:hypothetical protein
MTSGPTSMATGLMAGKAMAYIGDRLKIGVVVE